MKLVKNVVLLQIALDRVSCPHAFIIMVRDLLHVFSPPLSPNIGAEHRLRMVRRFELRWLYAAQNTKATPTFI
jgi:hypothetical protein